MYIRALEFVHELFIINFTFKTKESQPSCTNMLHFFCTSCFHTHDSSTHRFFLGNLYGIKIGGIKRPLTLLPPQREIPNILSQKIVCPNSTIYIRPVESDLPVHLKHLNAASAVSCECSTCGFIFGFDQLRAH